MERFGIAKRGIWISFYFEKASIEIREIVNVLVNNGTLDDKEVNFVNFQLKKCKNLQLFGLQNFQTLKLEIWIG